MCKRNIDWLLLAHPPNQALGPQPRHVPCQVSQPLGLQDDLNPLRHTSQGFPNFLKQKTSVGAARGPIMTFSPLLGSYTDHFSSISSGVKNEETQPLTIGPMSIGFCKMDLRLFFSKCELTVETINVDGYFRTDWDALRRGECCVAI